MIALALLLIYAVGFIVSARINVYHTKEFNENRLWRGIELGPRVYGKDDYRQLLLHTIQGGSSAMDHGLHKVPDDYQWIRRRAALWPIHGTKMATRSLWKFALHYGEKKTPGEIEAERRNREKELQRLLRENQRMRKEQGW